MQPAAPRQANGRLTIDFDALAENWRLLAGKADTAECAAVVKANGYGLGSAPVAQRLFAEGCRDFFVASLAEALALRPSLPDGRIFTFDGFHKQMAAEYTAHRITPVLSGPKDIEDWFTAGLASEPHALHVDTGMTRLGLSVDEMAALAQDPDRLNALSPDVVMTHFACADEPDDPMNDRQIEAFMQAAAHFPSARQSLANSAGVFMGGKAHFDLLRPGISIYGGECINDVPNPMRAVVRLEGRILQLRDAKKGETVGYGAEYLLTRDSRVAVIGIGYADGYPRSASGAGIPLRRNDIGIGAGGEIAGHKIPILGRVSMDLIALDVTDVPEQVLAEHEWIDLLNERITVDDVARSAGTIGYEILTNLGQRYERIYLGS